MQNNLAFQRRRALIQAGGALAGAAALGFPSLVLAQNKTIKIGFVSPQTGPLAPFGEADNFIIEQMNKLFAGGIDIGGKKVAVQILQKDSQSNPNRAGEVANDLILKDKVDLMLVSSTPETTNPVSDACELNEIPCISTVVPWQPWFFGRKGDPAKGFDWTYHIFWGLEDVIANFLAGWKSVQTNKKVGGLFPNDGDGNAWGDKERGFPEAARQGRLHAADPGRFQNMNNDFSAQIAAFKKDNCRDRHRRGDPARCQDFPHPGQAAGLQAEGRHARQGAAVPGRDRGARRSRRRPVNRSLVVAFASVHVVADQAKREAACRIVRDHDQEAVDAADRFLRTRCSKWRWMR